MRKTQITGNNSSIVKISFFKILLLILGIFSVSNFTSCKKDDDVEELSIYYKSKSMSVYDDTKEVIVIFTAMTDWYLEIDEKYTEWVTPAVWAGTPGHYELKVTLAQNTAPENRTVYINIHSKSKTMTSTITQRGYEVVRFEDDNFKQYCLDNFDEDKSGFVTSAEAHKATAILCPNMGITSFTGIEYFRGITSGDFSGNPISTLSLINSVDLETLDCSNCPTLNGLEIGDNMKKLTKLDCNDCALTNLTVDSCLVLSSLNCSNNNITTLNVSANKSLSNLNCLGNYTLSTIFINEGQSISSLQKEDVSMLVYPNQIIDIPDAVLKKYLIDNYDLNRDQKISVEEALDAKIIRCFGHEGKPSALKSLSGIEFFPNLETLECSYADIATIDLTHNPRLKEIYCHHNPLLSIDICAFSPLKMMDCSNCETLTYLSLNKNSNLQELHAENCNIANIDLTECRGLGSLHIAGNALTNMSLDGNKGLVYVDCSNNQIAGTLKIKGCDSLTFIVCHHNQITDLDVEKDCLYDLDCRNNKITSMDLSDCRKISTAICDTNEIATFTLPKNKTLTKLHISGNQITGALDVTDFGKLQSLYIGSNSFTGIDINGCTEIERIIADNNDLQPSVDFSMVKNLKIIDCRKNSNLEKLYIWAGFDKNSEVRADDTTEVIKK